MYINLEIFLKYYNTCKYELLDLSKYDISYFIVNINYIYTKYGIKGVYNLFKNKTINNNKKIILISINQNKFTFKSENDIYSQIFYTNNFIKKNCKIIIKCFRKNKKKIIVNDTDLLFEYVPKELGCQIMTNTYNKYYIFSFNDLLCILMKSLGNYDSNFGYYNPLYPKNPYDGTLFNKYQLTIIYDFLLNNNNYKFNYSKYNLIYLFGQSKFDLTIFSYINQHLLNKLAFHNYTKDLSNLEILDILMDIFKIFNVYNSKNTFYINQFKKKLMLHIDTNRYNINKLVSKYYIYFYGTKIDTSLLSNDNYKSIHENLINIKKSIKYN